MKFVGDLHTHTLASGHAHCTTMENAKYASEIGLEVLGITDHGPKMPGGPHDWYFGTFETMPRVLYGVTMLYGCEANILDVNGNLDLPIDKQENLDIMIASIHDPVVKPEQSADIYTPMLLKAMDNPNVHILGHIGNPKFPIYEEEIVKKAKEKNILIEINNKSFGKRKGSDIVCKKIALLCKEYGVKVIVSSDAHSCFTIANFTESKKILKEIAMPESLILNTSKEKILNFLRERGKNI